ncbi:MAG TPA: Rne/Rng family ribonuclease [Methylocystis sp.]|nr:Rne/Rng family ribonuclease [Methylocystis sp.]
MANKMLIDASHPEETRVVVLRGNKVQEFDFEAADKKPLRGNIYLAKVIRVEPSLQAAFVEYGGNRHGFLAFSEIHPDYYQIPVADRLALLEEERRAHAQDEEDEHHPGSQQQNRGRRSRRRHGESAEKRAAVARDVKVGPAPEENEESAPEHELSPEAGAWSSQAEAGPEEWRGAEEARASEGEETAGPAALAEAPASEALLAEAVAEAVVGGEPSAEEVASPGEPMPHEQISVDPEGLSVVEVGGPESDAEIERDHEAKARRQDERDEAAERRREEARSQPGGEDEEEDEEELDDEANHVEHVGGDAMEEVPYHVSRPRRQYKIQEVIKRRQVLLVQVVKEERGNKGAALTTYLSLAGRFSVLMPNTARGGGISRKITDGADRKRLKEIVHELEVPEGMGVILRTAGATRTKAEVKRDFEYLLRMWESVRELTLRSSAPMLVYEEGSLIKRAIRDLYGHDIDEVIVSGEAAYHEAHDFMRMLMPSHARAVKHYKEPAPIFAEAGVEAQLDGMFSNQVTLKSGGYLVINQTEALVAIDVNSGRSTREHNIEDTALRTNLEAADEVARQLRLRDLAGLIVVDFIDMEESRNNRSVERRIKEALKNDRARIQVGRISHFGLLEMSRQRMRAGVVEGSTTPCPHCAGAGSVRSTASIALHVLRVLEEALVKSNAHDLTLRTRTAAALYILNQKRQHLQNLEQRFGVHLTVTADDSLTGSSYHALERGEPAFGPRIQPARHLRVDSLAVEPLVEEPIEAAPEAAADGEQVAASGREQRGRGRGQRRPFERPVQPLRAAEAEGEGEAEQEPRVEGEEEAGEGEAGRSSRRRRRRRGRGGGGFNGELAQPGADQPSDEGLAFMAHIEGTPANVDHSRRPEREGRGRGRSRGPGRWTRSTPLPPEFRDQGLFPADGAASEAAVSLKEAHVPGFDAPAEGQAATPIAVETAAPVAEAKPNIPIEAAPAPEPRAEAARELASEPAPAETPPESGPKLGEVVITEADPTRPKKGGWWQRAKAGFGGA